ncbi:hypothetical protein ACWD5V_26190 [Streptomyces sp. NPDC002523]
MCSRLRLRLRTSGLTAAYHRRRDGNKLAVTHLDAYLAVPHSDLRLLLSFSSPMEPLEDALVTLFDSVARTLQWMA